MSNRTVSTCIIANSVNSYPAAVFMSTKGNLRQVDTFFTSPSSETCLRNLISFLKSYSRACTVDRVRVGKVRLDKVPVVGQVIQTWTRRPAAFHTTCWRTRTLLCYDERYLNVILTTSFAAGAVGTNHTVLIALYGESCTCLVKFRGL